MLNYDDAMRLIAEQPRTEQVESLPLADCAGHILASDLSAEVASPPFTNSAMDGFAFVHEEVQAERPLPLLGEIFAAATTEQIRHRRGGVVRIMTGAALPEWADTIIPVEDTKLVEGDVEFKKIPDRGSHVRRAGEDAKVGQVILSSGMRLTPERIMAAAAFGYADLPVLARPRIAVFSTGDELKMPGEPLPPGAIYNSSRFFLESSLQQIGVQPSTVQTLTDDASDAGIQINGWLESLESSPGLILTTGAVSAGDKDFLPSLAQGLGFKEIFHKVAIRPGKPVYFAKKGEVYWLGLPGNAVSTCVGWHFFARPLLEAVAGMAPEQTRQIKLKNAVNKPEHLRCFYRAELNGDRAWVPDNQGSARLMASVTAEAYVILPEGRARVPAGTELTAILL